MMAALLTTHANAKTSIELLQTLPLHQNTKEQIRVPVKSSQKLREMLADGQKSSLWPRKEGKGIKGQEASLVMGNKKDQKGKGKNVCFGDADACIEDEDMPEMENREEKQDFLTKIVEEIETLLQMSDGRAQDGIQACHRKENEDSNVIFSSQLSTEILSLLLKISEELKEYMKHSTGNNQQSASNFSYNTHPNSNNSNSGSVRSLLTQKLRQFANQDFDDPECKNERVVIQGNLMRQLSKYSRGSKPMIVSRRFQDLSQPFSMQNKIVTERQLQKWSKEGGRKEMKGRVHSQRTILGEINLSESHMKEKRAQKGEGGCSRCEIY